MILYELKPLNNSINFALKNIDVDSYTLNKFENKASAFNVYIKDIKTSWANIIKQEMLSVGGDAAISKNAYNCSKEKTDILLLANKHTLNKFIDKLKNQPQCFSNLCLKLNNLLNKNNKLFKVKNKVFDLNNDFLVMGILNLTPDSFSDGGKYNTIDLALQKVAKFIEHKTDIIDIGGVSTRPGSTNVTYEQELERVLPILEAIKRNFDVLISIDSHNPKFIKEVLNYNIDIINDISSGEAIYELIDTLIEKNISLILMNNNSSDLRGLTPEFNDFNAVDDFLNFKENKIRNLESLNFDIQKLCFDPGIGFGLSKKNISMLFSNIKSINQNALLVGLSRKSYFKKLLADDDYDIDFVSNAISILLMQEGVRFFRTHDPRGLQTMVNLFKAIKEGL